ncbi:2-succinyl-6-hydroxy-2,4-cyclohexadiene-1-carboxylate synthase [Parendozoicomonas sp. Alg238-R29]|uniref:2-succinyl-6-hydroxy-2, 4-cyclohexadiene-1-carboxylate synthase n=1 Tax=Parendozoicomonas sp. Alg238-R29 TaxID=2993446 RepID=UPI00248E2085|nr:2-succinyl-6-hydroxy-2,4-cyclohexadiene-1-carboxylate synthase [Parendozoicomonas sp. Alg238-R29]
MGLNCIDHGGQGRALVMIHGFLGSGEDWLPVVPSLKEHFHCYTIDLPGHGKSDGIKSPTVNRVADVVYCTLKNHNLLPSILVGYSLGGRVAMALANRWGEELSGLVLEGAHPGLTSFEEKEQRLVSDRCWAERFKAEAAETVLKDWYCQSVFSSLSSEERALLVQKRCTQNSGTELADMLMGCSLGAQENLWSFFEKASCPVGYLVGEYDRKFSALKEQLSHLADIRTATVMGAGHNTHRDNPEEFTAALLALGFVIEFCQ